MNKVRSLAGPLFRRSHGGCSAPVPVLCIFLLLLTTLQISAQLTCRKDQLLNEGWISKADSSDRHACSGFEKWTYKTYGWKEVTIPHNWDDYGGYIRLLRGNRHGYAWYRKTFSVKATSDQRVFLWFEGVGSYATVWVNGKIAGHHSGGRTSFSLDVTGMVHKNNEENLLAVRADHPAAIRDLPWVGGGCFDEPGFSEGSQPMGIFRPVHLVITGGVRIEPFGIHVWNDTTVRSWSATLYLESTLKNYTNQTKTVRLVNRLRDREGHMVAILHSTVVLKPGQTEKVLQSIPGLSHVRLWSLTTPYLYHLETEVKLHDLPVDKVVTPYGIRWIRWPSGLNDSTAVHLFYLNGSPVFINGIAGYEHAIGQSHAFTSEEIKSRAEMIRAAGFNAFRDAHQPHNLRFQKYWDSLGVLWWPQFSAHIWFDTPAFRAQFIRLLHDWVIERRNSPSLILWGLQNESQLPKSFAAECVKVIRSLDPTASTQRKITTCNGGEGTDWDVPQNWTGTYGGNPGTYARDLKKEVLVGEYGGWRTLDLHTEGPFRQEGPLSENRWCRLLEEKIRLANQVKDSVCGHFFWLFSSHDNPGRVQAAEGLRELDQVGPVNYKGLLTSWEEPTDGYYLYRSNFASKTTSPMVYIVSHTWPDRWVRPGIKNDIEVYSNCDSVALFNDIDSIALGVRKQQGTGTHFTWNHVNIQFNILQATGYVAGKAVVKDRIVLHHLPPSPRFQKINSLKSRANNLLKPLKGKLYLYRVNCGGPEYTDGYGNQWMADRQKSTTWGSSSWTTDYPDLPAFFASQRRISDPVKGTTDWPLFQTFRYGREKLRYEFPVKDGQYTVELYFTEPWWGVGGGQDCTGWRLFDVAINGDIVLNHFDIWKESGNQGQVALKRSFQVQVKGGKIEVSFPHTFSGQAVISAIAIAGSKMGIKPAGEPEGVVTIQGLRNPENKSYLAGDDHEKNVPELRDWMDTGDSLYTPDRSTLSSLPPDLYGAQWLSLPGSTNTPGKPGIRFIINRDAYVSIGIQKDTTIPGPKWMAGFTRSGTCVETDKNGGTCYGISKKQFKKGDTVLTGNDPLYKQQYIIAFQPVTKLQPAYDQHPVTSYDAAMATHSSALAAVSFNNKLCLGNLKSTDQWVEWHFVLGVANYYSFNLKYANPSGNTDNAYIELIADDGSVMLKQQITLKGSKKGKWNSVNMNTTNMINAGHYSFKLTIPSSHNLYIHSLQLR